MLSQYRMDVLDLRSDTVTRPTPGMRKAMAEAEVGDDVYGEDPTVNRLQDRVAEMLGKECALWVPTGTMANQLAVGALVSHGDEIVCERGSHIVNYEGAAAPALWGAQTLVIDGPRGIFDAETLRAVLRRSDDVHAPLQKAVAVENTHNRGGGLVQPLGELRALWDWSREAGVAVHLDGARLFNASVAAGVDLATYGRLADTASVCLSKGLGAPVGSVLVSSADRIAVARLWRKRLGGGMRQAGVLAAAGLYALDHHVQRLAEDHEHARLLAKRLGVDPSSVETNMVVLDDVPAPTVAEAARAQGVLVSQVSARRIRPVTHLDVDRAEVERAADVLATIISR
jgi:threonine aldolase